MHNRLFIFSFFSTTRQTHWGTFSICFSKKISKLYLMHGKYLQSIVGILHVCNICLLLSNTSSAWSLRALRMTNVLYAKALAILLAFWAEFNRDDPRRDGMSVQLLAKVLSTGDRSFLWFNKKKWKIIHMNQFGRLLVNHGPMRQKNGSIHTLHEFFPSFLLSFASEPHTCYPKFSHYFPY